MVERPSNKKTGRLVGGCAAPLPERDDDDAEGDEQRGGGGGEGEERPLAAHLGLGWLGIMKQKPAEARPHFKEALALVDKELATTRERVDGRYELMRLNALVGVALCEAALGNCPEAMRLVKTLPAAEQRMRTTQIRELAECAAH